MQEKDDISFPNLALLVNLISKGSNPLQLASNLRKIADEIEKSPPKSAIIPADFLASILHSKESEEETKFSESENIIENLNENAKTDDFFELIKKPNYSNGICTKRLRNNKICDTKDEYDIDEEDFVLITVGEDRYFEEFKTIKSTETQEKCEKLREEINFQVMDFKEKCIEAKCIHHPWCQAMVCLLLVIIFAIEVYRLQ